MSLLLFRAYSTATPSPVSFGEPDVPLIHARVAWRGDLTLLPDITFAEWVSDGSVFAYQAFDFRWTDSDSFGGGTALQYISNATINSGVDIAVPGTVMAEREYRFRVGLRYVAGTEPVVLRLGNTLDYAMATVTPTTTWAWHTVDWTPSAYGAFEETAFEETAFHLGAGGTAVTDVYATIMSGETNSQTIRFDHAEVYEALDEVTLQSLNGTRGSNFDGGLERPGRLDFSILDPDEVYTPRNTASSLYGVLKPGAPVHVRATHNGRLHPIGYGIVRGITPDPDTRTTSIICEDGLFALEGESVSRPFQTDGSYRDARAAALGSASVSYDLATDSIEASNFPDGTDTEEGLLDYLEELNEATGTVHFCAPQVAAAAPWKYTTITRTTLTNSAAGQTIDDDFQTLSDVSTRDESYVSRQRVEWVGYEERPSQVVVEATAALPYWTFTDELYGSSERPEPENIYTLKQRVKIVKGVHKEGKKEVKWKQRRRVRKLKRIGRRWVDSVVPIALGAGESKEVSVDFSVPMQDLSVATTDGGNVTTSLDIYPARVVITLTASSADTVTAITVTASPRLPLDEQEEDVSTTGSREASPIANQYIASAGMAAGLADYITWRNDGRLRPSVTDQHQMNRQLALDIGDHVTLSADRWHIASERYVVRSLEHAVGHKGMDWRTTYGLEELPTGGVWFTLDGSAEQGLDSSATLAH